MTKTAERNRRFVILDSSRRRFERFLGSRVSLCRTRAEIAKVYDEALDDLTWITYTQKFTDELLKTVARMRPGRRRLSLSRHDWVLTVASPRCESVPALHGLFSHIVGDSPGYQWLPKDELSEVLFDPATDPFPANYTKTHPALSLGTIRKIKSLRRDGHKLAWIAKELGLPVKTVSYHARKA